MKLLQNAVLPLALCGGLGLLSCRDAELDVAATQRAAVTELSAPSSSVVSGGLVLAAPASAASTPVAKVVQGSFTGTAQFKVWWDGTHLGVEAVYTSPTPLETTAAQLWNADSIELYLDGDASRGTAYDSFDRQFVITAGRSLFEKNGRTTGVIAQASVSGNTLTVRYAVPWSNLGVTAAPGMVIGLDVGVNDGSASGSRTGQAMAFGAAAAPGRRWPSVRRTTGRTPRRGGRCDSPAAERAHALAPGPAPRGPWGACRCLAART